MLRRARRRGDWRPPLPASPTHTNGGCTFAENPEAEAPEARIIWHADLDPGTLTVVAEPLESLSADAFDTELLAPWLHIVTDDAGEHAVLSDGLHHLRLDVVRGSILDGPVVLHYQLRGIATAQIKVLPLRRLIDLCRQRRFSSTLYPLDRRVERWTLTLRVHDAIASGATQREIGRVLFDADFTAPTRDAESLRARVRRLVSDARLLARGGYRNLLRRGRV